MNNLIKYTKSFYLFFFILFNIVSFGYAKDIKPYQWPLRIFNGLSGTFQEYRSGHFHAGFDLKTFQRTGFPVHAVSDGYIYKIRFVKRGSGRALYLKHSDGRISEYFHLDRFEKKIESVLKQIQNKKKRRYIGSYLLKNKIHYKKGEIIAYSGETGAGFPHLHLEIRKDSNTAINPARFFKYPGKDDKFPIIKTTILKPIGKTLINGNSKKTILKFKKINDGNYSLSKPLIITGAFDMTLGTADINDSGHKVAPYGIRALLDGNKYFEIKNDGFQRNDNNQLGLEFDLFYTSSGFYFYNIFYQEGFDLEKTKISFKDEISKLSLGKHRIDIIIEDYFGNRTNGMIKFIKIKEPVIEVDNIDTDNNNLYIHLKKTDSIGADRLKLNLFDDRFNLQYNGNLNPNKILIGKRLKMEIDYSSIGFVEFKTIKDGINYYSKIFPVREREWQENRDIKIDTFINRDFIYLNINNRRLNSKNISLEIVQNNEKAKILPYSNNEGIYFIFKPLNDFTKIFLDFSIKKNGVIYSKILKTMRIIPLYIDQGQKFKWDEFEAIFAKKTVREPRVLSVKKVNYESDFPILSQEFDISPYNFPFMDTVIFKIKKKVKKPEQVGIFQYNHFRKKWHAVYSPYNKKDFTFSRKLRNAGTIALMRDVYPPKIKFYKPKTKYRKYIKFINVIITDRGKGVNDNTIKITLNGKRINDIYDPDWSRVKIKDLRALKRGKNIIKISVRDYARYKTSKKYIFYLK